MKEIKEIQVEGYEKVIEAIDSKTGLHCFIAIHNTTLGPALGGLRIYPYPNREAALKDALLLAKAMTYKSAMAEDGLGGGKAVIIADPKKEKSEALLLSFADVLNTLQGKYITAEDVGSTMHDMMVVRKHTQYVAALPTDFSSGDPSRFTAWGVFQGIRAVAQFLWGTPSLRGKRIAIQGLGSVGSKLARLLFWEEVDLFVCDIDREQARSVAKLYEAEVLSPHQFHRTPCDIFAPCALGGVVNKETLGEFHCHAIAGAANNQLKEEELGTQLKDRGILYAPDFVINAGGIINASVEFEQGGYSPKLSLQKVTRLHNILLELFEKAAREQKPTHLVAEEIAEWKLAHAVGKRTKPLVFHAMPEEEWNITSSAF